MDEPEPVTAPVNWAHNVTFTASAIHRPATVAQVQSLVAGAGRVRALGTRHSFTQIADTQGILVSVAGLPAEVEVDPAARTARIAAGMRYADVARVLDGKGFALANLGSLPHISVAGACATGTHGSGVAIGGLATSVRELTMVTASGDIVSVERGEDGFEGAVVALGRLGVVVTITLDLVPSFEVEQTVYDGLPLAAVTGHFGEIAASGYSVSLFTAWGEAPQFQVWLKHRSGDPVSPVPGEPWFTAVAAGEPRHPIPGCPPGYCTTQGGVPGPWFERLPHFRPDFTPSAGRELQTEYLVAREHAPAALAALAGIGRELGPVVQISEIRTVAADGLWLSPGYGRDSAALHFTWIADTAAVMPAIALAEERLAPFDPRPHWGKIFAMSPAAVQARYGRLADFRTLAQRYDPAGKFANAFTDTYLSGRAGGHA